MKENIMLIRISFVVALLLLAATLQDNQALAADNGVLQGSVRDAQTTDPLPSASVVLVGTSFGAATDVNGMYIIRNIPPGTYTMRVSYIGYKNVEQPIELKEGDNLVKDVKLEAVAVQGEVVTVTAQARGQKEAINEQLASQQIVNVVSSARIQELPDANAAEAAGRLPGVSLLREGGEGSQVVIRGLAPKYNAVMVDGVRMAASNANDRSTDLSMISPDMLSGIEVIKTATADKDADVLGGSVDFKLRDANEQGEEGLFKVRLLAQGGYNDLPDAYNKYNNYKYVASIEDRFLDNRLGVFLQASSERRNLSSNELAATYAGYGISNVDYLTSNITVEDIARDRQRNNAVVALDYKLPDGRISFSNFLSTGITETGDRQQFFNVDRGVNAQNFISGYTKSTLNMLTNILGYEQQASIFHVKVDLSHSYSETKDPNDWTVNFVNSNAGLSNFGFATNLNPRDIVSAANNDINNTLLSTVSSNYVFTWERDLTAAVDCDFPLSVSDLITSSIKFGGKYRHQQRSYNLDAIDGEAFGYSSGGQIINQLTAAFPWFASKPGDPLNVLMSPFVDNNFSYGKVLGGNYTMVHPLDFSRMQQMVDFMNANQLPGNITYNHDVGNSIVNDYSGKEEISAAYVMATIQAGPLVTITPGVRFQQLKTVYTGAQGLQGPNPASTYDPQIVTYTAVNPFWLPHLLVRYRPFDWFDVRLAYTNTVAYPDYASLAPIITVAQSRGTLQWNGFKLDPMRSTNYDAYLSFYDNTVGLFTAGGFLKQITNLIYQYQFTPSTVASLANYYPVGAPPPTQSGLLVTEYINDPYKINNYGMELDWQTHFWYLPHPLDGLVMNVNYTHIFSKEQYPYQEINSNVRPTKYIDTSYYAPLLYQPDNILNLSLGYDYEGFSIRVSLIYSDKIFTGPNSKPQLLAYTSAYNRWDIAVKQELPLPGLEVYCNLNNINNADDISVIAAPTGSPVRQQNYGRTIDLGLRWHL